MNLTDSVVLVTGANRGIGRAFTEAFLARGARKVYAGARDPASVRQPGVEAVRLDVTNAEQVAAAAARLGDVTIVVNNAGIALPGTILAADSDELARRQLEVNFFGMLRVSRAFAPILAAHGGGALLNVLSIASWINGGSLATYATTKSAAWSLTNALRNELAGQGTQVTALHMSFVDTDLVKGMDVPKSSPADIVGRALDGLADGLPEVLADDFTQRVKRGLTAPVPSYLPQPPKAA